MKRACITLLATLAIGAAQATPRVVADDACPRYAIDIASFATCDGDVVAAEPARAITTSTERATAEPTLLQVSRNEKRFEPVDRKRKLHVPTH